MKNISGIYRIVCIANGNYYYGSSKNLRIRWGSHKRQLRTGKHRNIWMQQTWNKYGEDKFHIELIETVSSDKLLETEAKYLEEHVGTPHCMNILIGAYAPTRDKRIGICSTEKKLKISNTLLGHGVSEETRKKIGDAHRGKSTGPCSDERRLSIAAARRPNGFPKVKSPSGTVYDIDILETFCKEHSLRASTMSELISGKHKTHRGWRLA